MNTEVSRSNSSTLDGSPNPSVRAVTPITTTSSSPATSIRVRAKLNRMLSRMPRRLIAAITARNPSPTATVGQATKAERYWPPKARPMVAAEASPEASTAKATTNVRNGMRKALLT